MSDELLTRLIKHLKNAPKTNDSIYSGRERVSYGAHTKAYVVEIEATMAAQDKATRDAARYRWIVAGDNLAKFEAIYFNANSDAACDAAIDTEIAVAALRKDRK